VGVYAVSFVAIWLLFLTTMVGNYENPVMFLPMPVALLLVMVLSQNWLQRETTGVQEGTV
jgi:hypothetical protein